jgi:peptidoglycan/xylan/chitin deacetylase (PgdA/CDA1 family)
MLALALGVAAVMLCVILLLLRQPPWLVGMIVKRSPEVLYFVETTEPVVALTIDDGPAGETTPRILQLLERHGARATFFLISGRIQGNESVVRRIVEQGHEIGNHLTRDTPSIKLSPTEFEDALLEAHEVLSKFASPRWARPAGGWHNESMLNIMGKHDYRCALASVYPYDPHIPFRWYVVPHVLRNTRPGAIIVLHDGRTRGRRTLLALERILPELERRGFRAVTLSELVEYDGKGRWVSR